MDPQLRFGLSIVLSFVMWGLVAKHYVWPAVRSMRGRAGFRPLLLLHASRFVGLGFLVPGVVSPDLSPAFAAPAAYGDLVATILALVTFGLLETPAAQPLLWIFNVWGSADFLFAYYQGAIGLGANPGSFGAMYFVPTLLAPLMLVTHFLMFRMLLQRRP